VHSSTGVKLPVREIAGALPERVLVSVDGVHGFGVDASTIPDLRCHAFASGCHKWLDGPRGTGILWAGARIRRLLRPVIPSFDDAASYGAWPSGGVPAGIPDGARLTPGGFHSFEHRWALAEAFRFHEEIGRARVETRLRTLTRRLQVGLSEIKRVRLRTPTAAAVSGGLVCFEVAGVAPEEVVRRLAGRRIVASVTPYAERYVRLGPGIVNSPADADAAIRAVAAL
jgi:selenocysteine lyase/cysteine desulfurase